ncbi:MAG TPA: TolC family protein [Bryobacteraceae bacterium]|nr:TolC family protein [Bryobacteraceae bacterium]
MRVWLAIFAGVACVAQTPDHTPDHNVALPDYTRAAQVFPRIWAPYVSHQIPEAKLSNSQTLEVRDGKLPLSVANVVDAVIGNNLTVEAVRYYPEMAQTDLLRARSGASPRGVDVAVIPSVVFAGAEGGSILGTAGGSGGGANNAGGITGSASAVNIRPAGVFDPSISVSFSRDHTSSPLNTEVVSGLPSVTTGTSAFSVSYVQAFPSGTSIAASYSYQRQLSNQLHLLFDPDFTPGFTMTLSQQLVNGFGFAVNRALIKVAENEMKIERQSFRAQTTTVLASALNAYWDLMAAQEAVRAAELELKAALQLVTNNRKEYDVGVMSRLDIATAESQAASSQRDLVVAQTNEQNAELALKTLLTKNLDEPLASAAIDCTDPFPEPEESPLPSLAEALKVSEENRPEIPIAQGNINSEQDAQPFVINALLPTVNAFVLVSNVGLYNVYGTAFSEAVQFKYPQIAFGLSISFSLHNRQAQADEIRTRLELRQQQDTLVQNKSQIEVQVESALIAARQAVEQLKAAREALRLAEVELDAQQKRLTAGVSTAYNVVLAQRDVFTARLAEVQARDTYAKARVSLDQAEGTTFEKNHLTIDQALAVR